MKWGTQLIAAAAALAVVPLVHAQDPCDLLSTLRKSGFTEYAEFLETRAPLTLAKLAGRTDLTVWAPVNGAIPPDVAPRGRRRDAEAEARASLMLNDDQPPPPAKRRRNYKYPIPNSNFRVRRTFLNDPELVNLGAGQHLSLVSSLASPKDPNDKGADTEIITGLGRIVNATGEPIKFGSGVIYGIDGCVPPALSPCLFVLSFSLPAKSTDHDLRAYSHFSYPQLLSTTLKDAGATDFVCALGKDLGKFDKTPRITVFAPLCKLEAGESPKGQIVVDFLGYTPYLVPGATYGKITITKVDGVFFANGRRIVKNDVPIKNGVVHYLDAVHTSPLSPAHVEKRTLTRAAPQDPVSGYSE